MEKKFIETGWEFEPTTVDYAIHCQATGQDLFRCDERTRERMFRAAAAIWECERPLEDMSLMHRIRLAASLAQVSREDFCTFLICHGLASLNAKAAAFDGN